MNKCVEMMSLHVAPTKPPALTARQQKSFYQLTTPATAEPLGEQKQKTAPPWDAGAFGYERRDQKEKITDFYLAAICFVFPFSVSWVMLTDGAEVSGAHVSRKNPHVIRLLCPKALGGRVKGEKLCVIEQGTTFSYVDFYFIEVSIWLYEKDCHLQKGERYTLIFLSVKLKEQ